MHAVINRMEFTDPVAPDAFAGVRELQSLMEAVDGFEAAHVVRTGEREAVLVIVARGAETLDRLATEVGSPWMREHVVPLLAVPPSRQLGPMLASTSYDVG